MTDSSRCESQAMSQAADQQPQALTQVLTRPSPAGSAVVQVGRRVMPDKIQTFRTALIRANDTSPPSPDSCFRPGLLHS